MQKWSTNKKPIHSIEQKFSSLIWNSSNTEFYQKAKPDLTPLNSWCITANCHVKILYNPSQCPNSLMVQFLWLQWSCAGNHLSCTWTGAIIYARLFCVSSLDKCQPCRALKNKEKTFFRNHNMTRNADTQTATEQINKNLQLCCIQALCQSLFVYFKERF